mgnify:CR=1 FL=1|jgi:hypothetical protein
MSEPKEVQNDPSEEEKSYEEFVNSMMKVISQEPEQCRREGLEAQLLVAQNKHAESIPLYQASINGLQKLRVDCDNVLRMPQYWVEDFYIRLLGAYAMTLDFLGNFQVCELCE